MSRLSSTTPLRGLAPHLPARAWLAAAVLLGTAGCASASGGATGTAAEPPPAERSPEAARAETAGAVPDTAGAAYSEADVAFMQGMIHHHAQAVVMARMAPERAGSPAVRRLTARILNSQKTEIALMADWLRDRGESVPEIVARVERAAGDGAPRGADGGAAEGAGEGRAGDGGETDAEGGEIAPPGGWDAGPQMAGILSDEQMRKLEAARGGDFDRLFLTYMIEHHEGAVAMVRELVRSPDGAREEAVFRLASGIRADQATEIERMRTMLRGLLFGAETGDRR